MIKKLICVCLLFTVAFSSLSICSYAEDGVNWFVRRNGNKRPCFDDSQSAVSAYNGYFMDMNVNDNSSDKVIYLTFDAGYENGNTEKIMNTLRDEKISAAFFLLDNIIIKNTDLVIRMKNEGHLICNHTKNHKDLTKLSNDEIINDLRALEEIYKEKCSDTLSPYFRFPEGRYNERALKCVNEMGYKTIFWSFGYDDWDNGKQPDSAKAIKKILDNTHNGAVILLHPTSATNARIMPTLIKAWREMGYRFGTLDELTSK